MKGLLKANLLCAAMLTGTATWCAPAYAADRPTPEGQPGPIAGEAPAPHDTSASGESDELVITGSRIRRRDYQAESPIITIPKAALEVSGQLTIGESLNQLPQIAAGQNALRGGTRTTVDLRGLGSRRTLVLLDGKRMQPSDGFNTIDLDGIPNTLIRGVEIITGGASAVYGSDALAGVVNFQLRKDFHGLEVDGQQGITTMGDGGNFQLSATFGNNFAGDRGNMVVSGSYLQRDEIRGSIQRRFFSHPSPGDFGAGLIVPQATNPYNAAVLANLFRSYGIATSPSINAILSVNADNTIWARPGVNQRPYPGIGEIDVNGVHGSIARPTTFSPPLKRWTAFARATYDIADNVSAYFQFNWSTIHLETDSSSVFLPQDSPFVSASNPFIPADLKALLNSRPNPNAPFYVAFNTDAIAHGGIIEDDDIWQGQVGLAGKIPGLNWNWDAYFGYGRTTQNTTIKGMINRANFAALLNAPDGGVSMCAGGLDVFPFTYLAPVSTECKRILAVDAKNYQRITQKVGEANLTGKLFRLPYGDLRFAVGVAYRSNAFDFRPDAGLVVTNPVTKLTDLITSGQRTSPTAGSTNVKEIYGELLIPLLADLPFFHRLDVDLAARYSDYNSIGGVTTYKASAEWAPVEGLMFRGGIQRAIRAPSIGELYAPTATGATGSLGSFNQGGGDPCDIRTIYRTGPNGAQVAALCVAQGILASQIGTFQINGTGIPTLTSGNVNLRQETSDSITLGAVLTPRFSSPLLSGLSASVDFYDIKIKDAMGIIPGDLVVRACFNTSGQNPTYSNSNFYCQLISRGFISINQVTTPLVNLSAIQAQGIDGQLDWRVNLGDLGFHGSAGALLLNLNGAYLRKYRIATLQADPLLEYRGTIGNGALGTLSHPKWKMNATLTYTNGGFSFGGRARYIGAMTNSQNVNTALLLPGVNSITYFDLFARMNVTEKFSLRGGVTNVADRTPPVWTGFGATDSATYDTIGRSFYVGATLRF
jgi:iron complex outermembrane receptor protein